jgi:excisionase family DNA binding protein
VEHPASSADSLLTVDDIARSLKLNPQTVRNWIDRGFLRAIRIGRNVRVTRAEFDRLIEDSYTGPKPAVRSNAAQAFWDGELLPQVELP